QQLKLFNQIDNEDAFNVGEEVFKEILIAKGEVIGTYQGFIANATDMPERMDQLYSALDSQAESEYDNIKNLAVLNDIDWRLNTNAGEKVLEVNERIYGKLKNQLQRIQEQGTTEEFYNYVTQLRGSRANYLKVFDDIYETDRDLYWYMYDIEQGVMNQMQYQIMQISDAKLREEVINPLINGDIKNLRILQDLSNDFNDPTAKNIINSARSKALKQANETMAAIDTPAKRQAFLLANKGIPDVKDFAILELMEEQSPDVDTKQKIALVTQQAFSIIDKALAEATADPAKEKIFEQVAGNDPEQIIALQKLATKLPAQSQGVINSILDKQMNRVVQRIKETNDVAELVEFRQRIDGNLEVKNAILSKNSNIIEEINDYQMNLVFTTLETETDPNKVFSLIEDYSKLLEEFPEVQATIEQINPNYLIEYQQKQITKINEMISSTDNPEKLASFAAQLSKYQTYSDIDQSVLTKIQSNIEEKMKQNLLGEAAVQIETQYLNQYNISLDDIKNEITSDIKGFEFTGDYVADQERLKTLIYNKVEAKKAEIKAEIQSKIEAEAIREKAAAEIQQREQENINRSIPEVDTDGSAAQEQSQQLIDDAAQQAAQEAAQQGATAEEQQQASEQAEQEAQQAADDAAAQAAEEAAAQAAAEAAAQAEQEAIESQQLPTAEQIDCTQYNFPPSCGVISDSYQRQICEGCK
ncbi:hypothetical protein ACFL2U_03945, partial [Patescibacteria group bacterium]